MIAASPSPLMVPPGYRLLQRLGQGGCGEVWKAEAPGGVPKAIKFLHDNLEAIGDSGNSCLEWTSLQRIKNIQHPYILNLDRIDILDGQVVIVMELADQNLMDLLGAWQVQGRPGIPRSELLHYLAEAAEALDLMNREYGLQHFDIKPHNLFLVRNHCKVGDFGMAQPSETETVPASLGLTPVYASPESFEGRVSRSSDQYSLAIVYQELLTGIRPFAGKSVHQLLVQHLTMPPELSPLPSADQPIVARALAKQPGERFERCSDFIRALVDVAEENALLSDEATGGVADTVSMTNLTTLRLAELKGNKSGG